MPCAICLENWLNGENGDPVIAKTCGHVFHKNCLNNWFRHSRWSFYPCPLCNNPIMGEQNVVTLDLKRQIVPASELHALKHAEQRKVLVAKRKCCCKEDHDKRVKMQKLQAQFEQRKAFLETLRGEDDTDVDVEMESGDDEDENDELEEDSDEDV